MKKRLNVLEALDVLLFFADDIGQQIEGRTGDKLPEMLIKLESFFFELQGKIGDGINAAGGEDTVFISSELVDELEIHKGAGILLKTLRSFRQRFLRG